MRRSAPRARALEMINQHGALHLWRHRAWRIEPEPPAGIKVDPYKAPFVSRSVVDGLLIKGTLLATAFSIKGREPTQVRLTMDFYIGGAAEWWTRGRRLREARARKLEGAEA